MQFLLRSNKFIVISLFLVFFIAGLVTLSHYGVNWDAISHLSRGQAYLYYYFTSEEDYLNNKKWNLYQKKEKKIQEKIVQDAISRQRLYFQKTDTIFFNPDIPKEEIPRISIYQNVGIDLQYTKNRYDYGHPHISDVLSSSFNYLFYQKLGILNDIDSYHLYGVFLASLLIGLIFWWTATLYGQFAGLIAALSLSLYPLFWAESHFNSEKDIPETVFYSFMLFSFWKGITTGNWKWILISGIFFGLSLGTKFNVIFAIFIILPWFINYLFVRRKMSTKLLVSLIMAPILGLAIVIFTWPFFWLNPINKIFTMVNFYKTIGTTVSIEKGFIGPLEINTYAIQWILFTTPLVVLILMILGIVVLISRGFKKQIQSLLFLLWLVVPIARVTWPGTNIYGGVRQIMEFIPAMAIIAGVGGAFFRNFLIDKGLSKIAASLLILSLFIPITFKLIEIHPNENVYFNPLIGGLKGAMLKNFPGWGVSFGSPYREGIEWINKNAEPGAKLTLGHEILSNIPGIFIRPDIEYKSNRSGYLQEGEYVISLRFQGAENRSYFDMYLDKMLDPIHEITVDEVPILKIWKNDKKYLKSEWGNEKVLTDIKFSKDRNVLQFDIGKLVELSRLEVGYNGFNCSELSSGYFMISQEGKEWERVPGVLPEEVRIMTLGIQPNGGKFIEPFVGQEARFINFFIFPENTCVSQIESVKLYHF